MCLSVCVSVSSPLSLSASQPGLLLAGKTLCNIEQFGQYPLQVNGFNNLDECLEGAMVEKEIESVQAEHSSTPGREVSQLLSSVFTAGCSGCSDAERLCVLYRDGSRSCRRS